MSSNRASSDNRTAVTHMDIDLREKIGSLGLKASAASVTVSDIDDGENEFQSREGSIVDSETVSRYVISVEAGAVFPEIVLAKAKSGYSVVCGRHRVAAYKKAGRKVVMAIVIDPKTPTDRDKLRTISRWDNFRNGKPESLVAHFKGIAEECIAEGGGGHPSPSVMKRVAERNGLDYKTQGHSIRDNVRAILFKQYCLAHSIKNPPQSMVLAAYAHKLVNRVGGEAMARFVCENQSARGISKAVQQVVRAEISGDEAMAVLQDAVSGFVPSAATKMTHIERLRASLGDLLSAVRRSKQSLPLATDKEEVSRIRSRWDECMGLTENLIQSLEASFHDEE